jgi:hypothetical protein
MGLATPDEIRRLQRKLYVKAKGDDTRSPGGGPGIQPPGSLRGSLAPCGCRTACGCRACMP